LNESHAVLILDQLHRARVGQGLDTEVVDGQYRAKAAGKPAAFEDFKARSNGL
jgi:hypothetical protein